MNNAVHFLLRNFIMNKNLASNIPSLYIPSLEFIKKAPLPSFELPVYAGSELNFGRELDIHISYLEGKLHIFYDNKKLIVGEKVVMNGFIFVPATSLDFNGHCTNVAVACYFLVQVDGDTEEHFEKAVERFTKTFKAVKQTASNRRLKNQLLNHDLNKK